MSVGKVGYYYHTCVCVGLLYQLHRGHAHCARATVILLGQCIVDRRTRLQALAWLLTKDILLIMYPRD